jgi:FKBP-type peptidyl-prolyl cis-trans isomerase
MDTVDKIAAVPVSTHPNYGGGRLAVVPVTPVVIQSVRLVGPFDRSGARKLAKASQAEFDRKLAERRKTDRERLMEAIKRIEGPAKAKFTTTDSGLMYLDHRIGDGATPTEESSVVFQCRGTLLDGWEFENTYNQAEPLVLEVSGLIKGLREGLTTMNQGGHRTIIIPPELGFGESGVPRKIPQNAWIIFEIELQEVR